MVTWAFGFLVFVVVTFVALILFGGWVFLKIIGGIASLLGIRPQQQVGRPMAAAPVLKRGPVVQCRVPGCRHMNPGTARFCRHCGHAMPQIQPLAA